MSTTKNTFARAAKPRSFSVAGHQVVRANKETRYTNIAPRKVADVKLTTGFFENRSPTSG